MKGYIYILNKKGQQLPYQKNIKGIFSSYLNKEVDVQEQKYQNTLFYTLSNERPSFNHNQREDFSFGIAGYFNEDDEQVLNGLSNAPDKDKYVSQIGGVFSLALLDKRTLDFSVWNNVTRVEPVYWCETDDYLVVGTKAIVVHLLAYQSERPIYEIGSFTSFLNNGFFCDHSTPFKGVNVLETNSKLHITNGMLTIKPIDNYFDSIYSLDADQKFYDEITQTFLNSFQVLKKHDIAYTMGLTGGKDSRLVLAALKNSGIGVSTSTNGYDDSPDVILAKQIAALTGVSHKVEYNTPSNKTELNVDIRLRTERTIRNSEGMLYAYENISSIEDRFNPEKVHLGGQGGELLRGGYANNATIHSREQLLNHFKTRFTKYSNFVHADHLNDYHQFLDDYISQHAYLSYNDILNKFYLDFRCGRWSGTARSVYTMGYYSYAPFFDSQLVKKAQLAKTSYGLNDKIIYNILLRLEPDLVHIPFAADRWNFEKNKPYSRYDAENWVERQPVYPITHTGGFNWRRNILDNLSEEFSDVIFFSENSPLFDIVNKDKLKELFSSKQKNLITYDNFLWSLYTASMLLSNNWFESGKTISNQEATIKIPDKVFTKTPKAAPKLTLIPTNLLNPVHKKVKVNDLSKTLSVIEWDNAVNEDNLYFQLFDKPFSSPPSAMYRELANLNGITELTISAEVEKHRVDDFALEFFVMQYDKSKKLTQSRKIFDINEKVKSCDFTVRMDPEAQCFKVAFKINKRLAQGSFNFQQILLQTK